MINYESIKLIMLNKGIKLFYFIPDVRVNKENVCSDTQCDYASSGN